MATEKQVAANRKNALHSTGPRTPEGKAVARLNALKHGLLSKQAVLPDEDRYAMESFASRMRRRLAPEDELQHMLADRVIAAAWRLRRVVVVEGQLFEGKRRDFTGEDHGIGHAFHAASNNGDSFSKLSRYEANLERSLFRALHELQRLKDENSKTHISGAPVIDITSEEEQVASS